MTTYKVQFNGTVQDVETMVRVMDKLFRQRFNVYGGKRLTSYKDTKGYHVVMSYSAGWVWTTFENLLRASYRKIYNMKWIRDESYMEMRH